jgi:hypothetical protein
LDARFGPVGRPAELIALDGIHHVEVVVFKRRLQFVAACLVILGSRVAATQSFAADDASKETADQRFEMLYTEAMKAPVKADWKALRKAFAVTSHYQPYSVEVDEKLKEISKAIGRGGVKSSEEALLKLMERERHMRFDTVAMLMMLYESTKQPEKADKYKLILDGIFGVLGYPKGETDVPKGGTNFKDAIEVLFIQEEYLVTTNMPIAGRETILQEGHYFDVFEINADGDRPARKLYFNIDLPRKALSKSLEKSK